MGIYLRAADGAYADGVLVAGDSGRIARLGQALERAELITSHRGFVGYSGYYKGVRVSVQTSGMGCPSMAMVGSELLEYGVKRIIRIGTCSAFASGVMNGDLIVVTAAAAGDGTTRSLALGSPYVCVPDFELTASLIEHARRLHVQSHLGPVVTVDVEPHLTASSTEGWRNQGLLAVEMESAVLFHLALRSGVGGGKAVHAASVLTVSDGLEGHPNGAQRFMSDKELAAATERMHQVALDALIS